jgi:hypothetical protein
MARVGRRIGFMAGALVNVGGCLLAAFAIAERSFMLYCVATAVIGIYNAIGLQYRFAAAEVAAPADHARAISLVLAGGIAGGFLGPQSVRLAKISSRRRSSARLRCSRPMRSSRSPCNRVSTCRHRASRSARGADGHSRR